MSRLPVEIADGKCKAMSPAVQVHDCLKMGLVNCMMHAGRQLNDALPFTASLVLGTPADQMHAFSHQIQSYDEHISLWTVEILSEASNELAQVEPLAFRYTDTRNFRQQRVASVCLTILDLFG